MESNRILKAVFKDAWPYWVGAVLLAVLNISLFAFSGSPWGVTTPIAYWGAWIYKALGGHPEQWVFFQDPGNAKALAGGFLNNPGSVQNAGIVVGAFIATLLASQFKVKKIKAFRQVIAASLGGLLMGYGARVASHRMQHRRLLQRDRVDVAQRVGLHSVYLCRCIHR